MFLLSLSIRSFLGDCSFCVSLIWLFLSVIEIISLNSDCLYFRLLLRHSKSLLMSHKKFSLRILIILRSSLITLAQTLCNWILILIMLGWCNWKLAGKLHLICHIIKYLLKIILSSCLLLGHHLWLILLLLLTFLQASPELRYLLALSPTVDHHQLLELLEQLLSLMLL